LHYHKFIELSVNDIVSFKTAYSVLAPLLACSHRSL